MVPQAEQLQTKETVLLVLHESEQFGGHEIMFLQFLKKIAESYDRVILVTPDRNKKFQSKILLLNIANLQLRRSNFVASFFPFYRSIFRFQYARSIRKLREKVKPSTILLLQSRIEDLSVPIRFFPKEDFLVSYIPMLPNKGTAGLLSSLGNFLRRSHYRRPDRFAVPSGAQREQILREKWDADVRIVQNFVVPPEHLPVRALSEGNRTALYLGRFDVRQKGLDLLIEAIGRDAENLLGWTFRFVGTGAYGNELKRKLSKVSTKVKICIIPWTENPWEELLNADVLLLPSRWEGVPLVMLEAMSLNVPVIGSKIDAFDKLLPQQNRVDFGNIALASVLKKVCSPAGRQEFSRIAGHYLAEMSAERSIAAFQDFVLK